MTNKYRVEEKYYINQTTYYELLSRLKVLVKRDLNTDYYGNYRIDSLYFDDYVNSNYYQKLSGNNNRFKFRIRCYDLKPESLRLEKKIRKGDFIQKETLLLEESQYHLMMSGAVMPVGKTKLINEMALIQRTKILKPRVIVTYDREAFVIEGTNIRITFDKNLRLRVGTLEVFELPDKEMMIFKDDRVILEVKYDNYLPSYIRDILQTSRHEKNSISKYALCMEKREQLLI